MVEFNIDSNKWDTNNHNKWCADQMWVCKVWNICKDMWPGTVLWGCNTMMSYWLKATFDKITAIHPHKLFSQIQYLPDPKIVMHTNIWHIHILIQHMHTEIVSPDMKNCNGTMGYGKMIFFCITLTVLQCGTSFTYMG